MRVKVLCVCVYEGVGLVYWGEQGGVKERREYSAFEE